MLKYTVDAKNEIIKQRETGRRYRHAMASPAVTGRPVSIQKLFAKKEEMNQCLFSISSVNAFKRTNVLVLLNKLI